MELQYKGLRILSRYCSCQDSEFRSALETSSVDIDKLLSKNFFLSIQCPKTRSEKVEPIFNDTSNSDTCCYNDRFANPHFFLYLSHVICFYNNDYRKSLFSVIRTTWSETTESLGVKTERNAIRFCMRTRSLTFRLAVPSPQAQFELQTLSLT